MAWHFHYHWRLCWWNARQPLAEAFQREGSEVDIGYYAFLPVLPVLQDRDLDIRPEQDLDIKGKEEIISFPF
jgi:hypothetical protein